jgi:hypothetical protein
MKSFGARLQIDPATGLVAPALAFLDRYTLDLHMEEGGRAQLREAVQTALELVIRRQQGASAGPVSFELFLQDGTIVVETLNQGVPIVGEHPHDIDAFYTAARGLDEVKIENLGRKGQKLVLSRRLGVGGPIEPVRQDPVYAVEVDPAIEIRELRPGEEDQVTQLFYFVYGYSYINELVYFPEKLRQAIETGRLISSVAVTQDRVIGHCGLTRWAENPPVYEAGLGLVDPRVKSRGLFSRLFEHVMQRVTRTPMQYCYFDLVTNHDRSQKVVARYNPADMAIFVGCQNRETQARLEKLGMGQDPEGMDRYSLLYSIVPRVPHPFGREVQLPASIGDRLGFLLEPLGLKWFPESRFAGLPARGTFHTTAQPQQGAVLFDLAEPGRIAVDAICTAWRQLLLDGYEYAAVEVPLDRPGLGVVAGRLSDNGFFAAGFVPYRLCSDRLAFRFQALGHAKVAMDHIRLATDNARRLFDVIQTEYAMLDGG